MIKKNLLTDLLEENSEIIFQITFTERIQHTPNITKYRKKYKAYNYIKSKCPEYYNLIPKDTIKRL